MWFQDSEIAGVWRLAFLRIRNKDLQFTWSDVDTLEIRIRAPEVPRVPKRKACKSGRVVGETVILGATCSTTSKFLNCKPQKA